MYENGLRISQNYHIAFEYYVKASKKGCSKAFINLGNTYRDGILVDKNGEIAFLYYNKALNFGNNFAYNELGKLYQTGNSVSKDLVKAKRCYELAAKSGCYEAYCNLGDLYFEGVGVKKNLQTAIDLYNFAYEKKCPLAATCLGYLYLSGIGRKLDFDTARSYFEKASEMGSLEANSLLGVLYFSGLGGEIDEEKGLSYLKKSGKFGRQNVEMYNQVVAYNNDRANYVKLFSAFIENFSKDDYYKNIKNKIDNGARVYRYNSLGELSIDELNNMPDDSIINIRQKGYVVLDEFLAQFYTVSDMKIIYKIINKILQDIDLNQPEEDIFMQIYIKLGLLLSYDRSASSKLKDEKHSVSRNLIGLISKKTVCSGYTEILKCVLSMVGIDSISIHSNVEENFAGHEFIQVKINGKWYYCDLTFDSESIKNGKLISCLQSKDTFLRLSYHKSSNICTEHDALEDYPDVDSLFVRNMKKVLLNKFIYPFTSMIRTSPLKEEVEEELMKGR